MPKSIKQVVKFKATPHEVYEALMDSKKHSEFTNGKAVISRKVGGKFTAFDGYSEGENLKLTEDKLIEQTWRASDWPDGHFSTVKFELKKDKAGTILTFTQKNIPDDQAKSITQGWKDYYWTPMKEMIEQ